MKQEPFDSSTFQEILDSALEEWKQKSGNEVVYPSDVSYTLLEMMAMLVDMLHYYMAQQTDEHREQYRSLWQQSSEDVKQSFPIQVITTHDLTYQKGMVLHGMGADTEIPLEVQEATAIAPVKMIAMYYKDEEKKQRIDMLLRQEEGTFTLPREHENAEIMILLDAPFQYQKTYAMYVSCDSAYGKDLHNPFSYATWDLMYYGTSGWQTADVLYDASEGFLYSGFIRFQIPDHMTSFSYEYGSVYAIKFVLRKEIYDRMPCLRSIWLSIIEVKQQEHLMRVFDYVCNNASDIPIICEETLENKQLLAFKEDKEIQGLYHPIKLEKKEVGHFVELWIPEKLTYPVHIRMLACKEHPYEQTYQGVTSQKVKLEHCIVEKLMIQTIRGYQEVPCYQHRNIHTYGYGCWQENEVLTFGNGRDFKIMEKGNMLYGNLVHFGNTTWDKHQVLTLEDKVLGHQLELSTTYKQQEVPYETLITSEDIVQCVLQMPVITLQKAVVYKDAQCCWTLYIKNETNQYTREYLAYLTAYLEKRLLLGMSVCVQPFTIHLVKIEIHCIKIDDPNGCIQHLRQYMRQDRNNLHIDQLIKECQMFIPQTDLMQILLFVDSEIKKEMKLEEYACFELKECHIWDGRTHYE